MEEILKILESSDIECDSSDDDDPDLQLHAPDAKSSDDEEEKEETTPVPSTSKGFCPPPSSLSATLKKKARNVVWKKKSFTEKPHPLPASEGDHEPLTNVSTPLSYFVRYFDDEFFENAAEKTSMYHLSKTGKVLKVTPQKIKQLFGMHNTADTHVLAKGASA